MYSVIGQPPRHYYVWIDSAFTHREPQGFLPAVWFGLVSVPGRCWGCTVLLESGAVYRNLPPHALAVTPDPAPLWTPQDAQTWDCYGERFSAIEYRYLDGLDLRVRAHGQDYGGRYLFTVAPIGDGFSRVPEQAKEFTFIALDNGRLTVQPTNHVLVRERSFTTPGATWPTDLRRQTEVYACE